MPANKNNEMIFIAIAKIDPLMTTKIADNNVPAIKVKLTSPFKANLST